jgi:hypothetical protein
VLSKRGFSGLFAPFRPIAEQLLEGGERALAEDFRGSWLMSRPIRADRPDSRRFFGAQTRQLLRRAIERPCFFIAFE